MTEPDDFDAFWKATLAECATRPVDLTATPVDTGLAALDVSDVAFTGYGGVRVRGWLLMPAHRTGPLPCVVQYRGYGSGRGLPHEHTVWAAAGYATLVMDNRGQAEWHIGATPDVSTGEPEHHGVINRGARSRETYYYRRLYTDAARAVQAARAHPDVDPDRVAVAGRSQGGALALAAAALADGVGAALVDVPYLCDLRNTLGGAAQGYTELIGHLRVHHDDVDAVLTTLSYVDGVSMARRGRAPALWSVALRDPICPPDAVRAAYAAYGGEKDIVEYPFNEHEGGETHHVARQIRWLSGRWPVDGRSTTVAR